MYTFAFRVCVCVYDKNNELCPLYQGSTCYISQMYMYAANVFPPVRISHYTIWQLLMFLSILNRGSGMAREQKTPFMQ